MIDRWGIPHIYAKSANDVYIAQGFNAARERLWQLDYARRRGLGLLAEAFGPKLVPWDRAARRLIYRGDMRAEWLSYSNRTKAVATSFTAGVNAYIELTEQGEVALPHEFEALGYRPGRWDPADVTKLRAHGLSFNAQQEVARAITLHNWGRDVEDLRKVLEPEHEILVPDGLDLAQITSSVLDEYNRATLAVQFTGAELDELHVERMQSSADGSNNWVIAPERTSTGRPILANDPHRVTSTLPSLRYIAHLSCDDFDVIGGGEPILPGISIGHNGTLAFGLTIFAIDQEDLVMLALDPSDPDRYLYQGDWVPFERVSEEIPVRGGQPVTVTLDFSRFGPVIHRDADERFAVSLAAAWLEPGGAPYLGSMEYMTAETVDDFLAAMNRWGAPPENQIVADTTGRIAWKPGGITPVRHTWDGLLPVPGNGEYEWDGFYDADVLPLRDQRDGFIATANNFVLDDDHDPAIHVSYEWSAPFRHRRITEWLASTDRVSVRDAFDFQMDDLSIAARETIGYLSDLEAFSSHPLGQELSAWDRRMSTGSRAALIWERWTWQHLLPALFTSRVEELGHSGRTDEILALLLPSVDPVRDLRPGLREMRRLGDLAPERLTAIVAASLQSAHEDLERNFPGRVWGDLHQGYAHHPLADLLEAHGVAGELVRIPPFPRAGSADTVGMAAYATPHDYRQVSGSTFRLVIDVGEWDNSIALNAPGQSGDITSGKAQQNVRDWEEGTPFPLLYSRELIEEATVSRIDLVPDPA